MKISRKTLRKMILKEMWSKDGNWWHNGDKWISKSAVRSREFEKQMSRLEGEEGRKYQKQLNRYNIMRKAYQTPVTMETMIYVDVTNQFTGGTEQFPELAGAFAIQKDFGWNPNIQAHLENDDLAYKKIEIAKILFELPINSPIPNHLYLKFRGNFGTGNPLKKLIEYLESQEGGSELAQEILAKVEEHNEEFKDYDPAPRNFRTGPRPAEPYRIQRPWEKKGVFEK